MFNVLLLFNLHLLRTHVELIIAVKAQVLIFEVNFLISCLLFGFLADYISHDQHKYQISTMLHLSMCLVGVTYSLTLIVFITAVFGSSGVKTNVHVSTKHN